MKKRILSILLVLVMVLCLMPTGVLATDRIKDVTVTGIVPPKAGQAPTVEGLKVKTSSYGAKLHIIDSYWTVCPTNPTYTYNPSMGGTVDEFEPNRTYALWIKMYADPSDYAPVFGITPEEGKLTIKAAGATKTQQFDNNYDLDKGWLSSETGYSLYYCWIKLYYDCETYLGNTFENPDLYDMPEVELTWPQADASPNFTVTSKEPTLYEGTGLKWYPTDKPSNTLKSTDKFLAHVSYTCEFTLKTVGAHNYFDTTEFYAYGNVPEFTYSNKTSTSVVCKSTFDPLYEGITGAKITGVKKPAAGEKPQTTGISGGNNMTLRSVELTKGTLDESGAYKPGETYTLTAKFDPKDGYYFDYTKISSDTVTADYGNVINAHVGEFDELIVNIQFTVEGDKEKIDLGDYAFDMSSGSCVVTDYEHPAALLLTVLWLGQAGEKKYASNEDGYDLDKDGKTDVVVKTSGGVTTLTPSSDTALVGAVTLSLDQSTIDGFIPGTEYYSSLTFRFPGEPEWIPEDKGAMTLDLRAGDVPINQAVFLTLDSTFMAMASAGQIQITNESTAYYVDLDNDSINDLAVNVRPDGAVLSQMPYCSVGTECILTADENAVTYLKNNKEDAYYSKLTFQFADEAPAPTRVMPFTDVIEGKNWFYDDVKIAYENYLIDGYTDTTYEPGKNLTYAQAVKLAACMHEKYTTGKVTLANSAEKPWYKTYVDYAKLNGIISRDYEWNADATRAGYIEIFAHALPDAAFSVKNTVADNAIPDVKMDHPQAAEIYKLYRAGILEGSSKTVNGEKVEHFCNPGDPIRRSEVAAILTRMMYPGTRKPFTLT